MSDDLATVLLQLRLRAFATTDVLRAATAVDGDRLDEVLRTAESDRLVRHREGRIVGWSLTAAGRTRGQELLSAELDAAGTRDAVFDAYGAFLPLNAELLSICTDWQVVVVDGEHVPNDHSDPERDSSVLARLARLHPAAVEVTSALGRTVPRFAGYGPRLIEAHDHVLAGRTEWLTRVTGDSYHGVWFELHEHLLAVLGRDREHEATPDAIPTTAAASGRPGRRAPGTGDTP